ncbi:MAG: hypothetical protein V4812_15990 [Pseudomonadota bacterium]
MFNLAKHRPYKYVRYMVSLLTAGEALLGGLLVKPSAACRQAVLQGNIDIVDWVALASLRDSSNGMLSMSGPGSATAGITMASMLVEWFNKCGFFTSAGSQVNYVFGTSAETLMNVSRYHATGSMVYLYARTWRLAI